MAPRHWAFAFALVASLPLGQGALAASPPLTPRQIYKTFGKGVVLVFATDGSAQGSAGTGSIITKDGQIITNAHVVSHDGEPYKKLFVYLKPDKLRGSMKDDLSIRYKATLVDVDYNLDLALLRMVDGPADTVTIDFANPDDVEIGEPVVAIGHPETGGLWTLTTGSISSVVADFNGVEGKDVFQTEASVNRGNSGGPLLNAYGQMVGINTCISRKAADGLAITDINFSLKSSVAVDWMKKRKLMELAYAKPGEVSGGVSVAADPQTQVAMADTKAPAQPTTKVDSGDGKIKIEVVEPQKGEEVADDPEFQAAAKADQENVSRGMAKAEVKTGPKLAKPEATTVSQQTEVKPKHLTKARPYKLDPFIAARNKEIKALENMMDDMSKEIEKKSGKQNKVKSDGMGLW